MPRPTTQRASAIANFIAAHDSIYGRPSGKATFKITVSKFPKNWEYYGRTISGDFTTNLMLDACISPQWAKLTTQAWSHAAQAQKMIVLGAVPAIAPPPATKAWLLHTVVSDRQYHGFLQPKTYLSLGSHFVFTTEPSHQFQAQELTNKIVQSAHLKLHGHGYPKD